MLEVISANCPVKCQFHFISFSDFFTVHSNIWCSCEFVEDFFLQLGVLTVLAAMQ
jgi:hypothetical protein